MSIETPTKILAAAAVTTKSTSSPSKLSTPSKAPSSSYHHQQHVLVLPNHSNGATVANQFTAVEIRSAKHESMTSSQLDDDDVEMIKAGSEVTALFKHVGKASELELSFEYGDLIKIVEIVDKDPNWALAELKGKRGYIGLNHVKPKAVTMPWFHNNLTREQAEFLLKDRPEGDYLMRESTHYPGDFTLCLKSSVKVENYHIKMSPTSNNNNTNKRLFTIDDENFFANLIELVEFYTHNDHLACMLVAPVCHALTKRRDTSDYQALLNTLWIDEAHVSIGKEIGVGEFGAVYKATYKGTDVAVKKIKERTTVDEFIKEAFVMSTLSHPNLVKLIGVVKHLKSGDKFEISLVTEFMPKGNLHDYLTSRGRTSLTNKKLIEFVIHIGEAMSYLEEKGIVHRDLAASNVLLSEEDVAKVSDFGLAKKILDDNKNGGVRIRIKWTAPEAIKEKLYSNKSDMWSFGILLWEIFSYGRTPYPKFSINEVLNQIEQGYQMDKPDGCPDEMYALMKDTWQKDRTLRPTFSQMLVKLYKVKSKFSVES